MARNLPALTTFPNIDEKVALLKQRRNYCESTSDVEFVESHMACVFLTDEFAYKLKKPAKTPFLDFSTIEKRRDDCVQEVLLNRRLAKDVYLGIVPLLLGENGRLEIGSDVCDAASAREMTSAADWLVKMRRLPADRMLDMAIENQTVDAEEVRQVGYLLAGFYRSCRRVDMEPAYFVRRQAVEIRMNCRELLRPHYQMPAAIVKKISTTQLAFVNHHSAMLGERVRQGHLVDAHGDLRPEHICLEKPPVIIDCLEFNDNLRMLDSASDLAFLTLECERQGAAEIAQQLWGIYCEQTGDKPEKDLLAFYRSHHALSRAKIAVWHLNDPGISESEKWVNKARRYVEMAMTFDFPHGETAQRVS